MIQLRCTGNGAPHFSFTGETMSRYGEREPQHRMQNDFYLQLQLWKSDYGLTVQELIGLILEVVTDFLKNEY